MRDGLIGFGVGFALFFFLPILSVFFGAFSGWAVGFFFEDTIRRTLGAFGVNPPVSMWEMGATLGFIGGYLKSINYKD